MTSLDDFRGAILDLDCPFLFEPSVRFCGGEIQDRRVLVSMKAAVLRPSPSGCARRLASSLAGCAVPDDFAALLEGSEVIHFGFEDGTSPVFKIYAEFTPGDFRPTQVADDDIFIALKFSNGSIIRSHYREWRSGGFPSFSPSPLHAVITILFDRASEIGERTPPVLVVTDLGTPRRSIDVNLYGAAMTVKSCASALSACAEALGFTEPELRTALEPLNSHIVGHVAVGQDRSDRPFLTLYHGVGADGWPSGVV